MNPALLLLLLVALCLPAAGAAEQPHAPTEAVRILARLPHDPGAFTQGLLLRAGELYESTGLYGQSSLRRVTPATGRVLLRRLPERLFGEGLALCPATAGEARRERLVQLTWREGLLLLAAPEDLRPLGSRKLRGQGWGLAEKDGELALSDGSDSVRFLDCASLKETGRLLRVRDGGQPVARLNELEWVNGWLLANVWQDDRVAVIDPRDGRVALWLDLSPLRRELSETAEAANGIAFDPAGDGGRGALYLTGKRWETLFVAALPGLTRRPPGSSAARPGGT